MSQSTGSVALPEARSWRVARLLDAPHRLAFAAAALVLGASSIWWAVINLSRADDVAVRWGLPSPVAHSLIMTFGFMPLFFMGFLSTAGPKWLKRPPVMARDLFPALLPQVAGWAVFMAAVHGRDADFGQSIGAIGLAAVALGWLTATGQLWRLLNASTVADRTHLRLIAIACTAGAAALGVASFALASGNFNVVRAATHVGLWGFVGLVFAAAAHRVIPFFSAAAAPVLEAWSPQWLLWLLVGAFAFEALAPVLEALGVARADAWYLMRAAVELPTGVGCLLLSVQWGFAQSLRARMLAMLHVGFTWLGIALLMFGASHAMAYAAGEPPILGLAPMHAFTMGYLGSTMLAMVTRIACGHGGRRQTADDFIWRLFWVLQLAIVARLAAALLPSSTVTPALLSASAVGWAAVCCGWAVRYGRWFGTPRPDGRQG